MLLQCLLLHRQYCSQYRGGSPQRKVCRLSINIFKEERGHSWKQRTLRKGQSTFSPGLPQLSILDEPCEHLRFHEDAQETTDAFRRHRLAEGLSLENALSALVLSDKQGVMADGLQEEADEGL